MSRKKPALTKAGAPRKRAPGAGRPSAGRSCNLPRVSKKAKGLFAEIAEFRGCSLARAVEIAAEVAMDAMEGRPISPDYHRYK
jgi:hypothetical protein